MRTARIVLAIAIGIALNITVGLTQASAQTITNGGTKPPKPPKSDDKGPKPHSISIETGALWIAKIPATRTALTSGILTGGVKLASCGESNAAAPGTKAVSALTSLTLGKQSVATANCAVPSAATAADATALRSEVVLSLTEAGAPLTEATALTDAITGILSQPKPDQLAASVDRFNRLVMAAPNSFLSAPPAPFLAIHGVLQRLLGVENAK